MMDDLQKHKNLKIPNTGVLKDIFDFIDIKKDGYIDLNEWL